MNFGGAPNGFYAGFRKSNVAYLAFLDQLCQTTHRFFDGRVGINSVLIIKINVASSKSLEAALARLADVIGFAIYAASLRISGITHDAELSGNDQLVPLSFDRVANEFFIFERAIH